MFGLSGWTAWSVGILAVTIGCVNLFLFSSALDSEACAALRRTLLAQQAMDKIRSSPKSLAYVPNELVTECGAEAFRMPFPYMMGIGVEKSEEEVMQSFFTMNKSSVFVRDIPPFNESFDHLLTTGYESFTDTSSRELPVTEARECITDGTCALYFDNSWTWDDIKPFMEGSEVGPLLEHTRFGNMFMSNLPKKRLTARLHSAPLQGSIVLQFAGAKIWKFWNPETLGKFGVYTDESSQHSIMTSKFIPFRGMQEAFTKMDHYDAVTNPGDIIYFPAHWTHITWTDASWNAMINLRMRFTWKSLIQSFKNACHIHSLQGALRIALHNAVTKSVPETLFKTRIKQSHDNQKMDGWFARMQVEFVKLNMQEM